MKTTAHARELVQKLKQQLGDYEVNEDDFYEPEEIAEAPPSLMFGYFRQELDERDIATVERYAAESKLFLDNLIQIGEIVVADQESEVSPSLSWLDLQDLAKDSGGDDASIALADREAMRLEIPSAHMMAASSSEIELRDSLTIGLDVDVFEEDGKLVIDLTSNDKTLAGELVGFCVRGKQRTKLGVVLLCRGESGVTSGTVELDRSEMAGDYSFNVTVIEPSDLGGEELELVRDAIERDANDSVLAAAWMAWIKRIASSEDGPGLKPDLDSLEQFLSGN